MTLLQNHNANSLLENKNFNVVLLYYPRLVIHYLRTNKNIHLHVSLLGILIKIPMILNFFSQADIYCMVPTGSDESKLRTFQGPFQDQISHYKDFYGEFHNANIPNTPHICGDFLLFSFWDITSDLIGYLFYILKESWQNVHFGTGCLLNW